MEKVLEAVILWPLQDYFRRCQDTIEECIDTQTIYLMCTGMEWFQDTSQMMWWWINFHRQSCGANLVSRKEEGKVE